MHEVTPCGVREKEIMKSTVQALRDLVQTKLPHTSVFWNPAPISPTGSDPGTLWAVNKKHPNRKGAIRYEHGIAQHSIEALAADFVVHKGPDVSDSNQEK